MEIDLTTGLTILGCTIGLLLALVKNFCWCRK